MSDLALSKKTAIVGIATSDFAALYRNPDPERTKEEMAVAVMAEALEDAGLEKSQYSRIVSVVPSRQGVASTITQVKRVSPGFSIVHNSPTRVLVFDDDLRDISTHLESSQGMASFMTSSGLDVGTVSSHGLLNRWAGHFSIS